MNCQHFVKVVSELARAQVVVASLRDEALQHSTECSNCATRLADEKTLLAGLRALANCDANKQAPPQVAVRLLDAFRAQAIVPQSHSKSRSINWALALAATIVIALGGAALWQQIKGDLDQTLSPGLMSATIEPDSATASPTANPVIGPESYPVKSKNGPAKNLVGARRVGSKANSPVRYDRQDFSSIVNEVETAADFLPLLNNQWMPVERSQIIRVQMPRSDLMYFGLPVRLDRRAERIQADLLMSEDGLARAIRFVQ